MGLVQDVHTAVTRYEDGARAASLAVHDLATTVAQLQEQLAVNGPLGASTDPDLARARARLTVAHQRLLAAAETVEASRREARAYADRAFPA